MILYRSIGTCLYCNETLGQKELKTHLNKHIAVLDEDKNTNDKLSFLIKVTGEYKDDPHFLYLLVDGDTEFDLLDSFLREIWLECCGHMSSFSLNKKDISQFNFDKYLDLDSNANEEDEDGDDDYYGSSDLFPGEIPFNVPVKDVLIKGRKLSYTYDYGSTTSLNIITEYVYKAERKEFIELLSRNKDFNYRCDVCKETAFLICTFHSYSDQGLFCMKCAKKHKKTCSDFSDFEMPIVNSPRMGVCAYSGGSIDTKGDGPWQGKYEMEEE
ncbi:MAG: hypothetical protein IPI15_09585 [Saprospiraceae bacterium]|uniref:hypothetical protein n=1 Tax=Candidatus Brachybacter algidus TaxID=2982024 RepID=UPI00257FA01E|nr:hypothetical protein [Candidatus Brachybacter algidus]MBK7603819.1 hypothetical protein [Candidatus Brachybacter algidus]